MNFTANIGAVRAGRVLEESSNHLNKALARLGSGTRLVSPEDDSAGLVVSKKFSAESTRNHAVQNNLVNTLSLTRIRKDSSWKLPMHWIAWVEFKVLVLVFNPVRPWSLKTSFV